MGELEKIKKNYLESLELYLKAHKLEPSRLELLETAGRLAFQIKDFDRAQAIFKQLTILEPNQPRLMGMFIDLVMNSKDYQEGIDVINSLNMKHGESPERMAQMGLLMYKIGEKEKAIDLLESAIEDLPQNTNFYFSLFDLYMDCLLYTSPSPRDLSTSRMPSSA